MSFLDEPLIHSYNGFMNFYFAPMEGITRYPYRNAHHMYFNNIAKYFSPFITASESGMKKRELNDILPENNQGLVLIPQLLTNKAKDFNDAAKRIRMMGYDEINLNLGCPSGTVVAKNKGSGFLALTKELDQFLYEIFSQQDMKISVKTRIGRDNPEEFHELIEIFNKYPIAELTIHPRVQKDHYKNKPNLEIFREAFRKSKNPVCYNGDIFTINEYNDFIAQFPEVGTMMIGRGLLANPGMTGTIRSGVMLRKEVLKEFHDKVYNDYKVLFSGDVNVLYKMKEIWSFMITAFSNNEKYAKKIRKTTRLADYEQAVESLFREQDLLD